ncbi:1-phosphofructokinase [Eubacterium sp.]|uniref:1-phosphofructokinase n=1 Tax=Eubacterium sp. TaxID=142586 RepID=UPI0025DCB29E|nr:1-phosphofructokinase [Eubacterium sp.]MCR5629107.1 1-phosphofructokinase [Eubacterium sp.]
MIYTITFNPSLDLNMTIDDLKISHTNRARKEELLLGGKGINVSTVLKNLGYDNTAIFYSAGFTGDEIEKRVHDFGIKSECIKLEDGLSRINVKIKNIDGTEINGLGPNIPSEKVDELLEKLKVLKNGDVIILAGSIPSSMPNTIYSDILNIVSAKDIKVVVDATGELLLNTLKYEPFLIKPNNHELEEIFKVKIEDKKSIISYAKKLKDMGAKNVLVSMAGDGALLVADDNKVYESEAPAGKVVNAVGAGDSMVAGFIAGCVNDNGILLDNINYEYAFRLGLSAGSASAFSSNLATKEEIINLYKKTYEK